MAPVGGDAHLESVVTLVRYEVRRGPRTSWDEGSVLRAEIEQSTEPTVVLSGNKSGLASMARHLLTLAQEDVPAGSHLDFDTYCGWLAQGSAGIGIEVE